MVHPRLDARGLNSDHKYRKNQRIQPLESHRITAIHGEYYTGDIFGLFGCEEECGVADIAGVAEPSHGGAGEDLLFPFHIAVEGFRGHVGGDESGGNAIDEDAFGGQFDGHGFGHAFDGRFGCGIGDHFGDAVLCGHGADVDDMSFSAGQHGADDFAAYGEDGAKIGVEDAFEVLVRDVREFLFHVDAGVVDEDIDEAGDGGEVIEVLAYGLAEVAELFLCGVELFLVAANDDGEDRCLYKFLC